MRGRVVLRCLGLVGGLLTQPFLLALSSIAFMAQPVLMVASALKIADRGLSYSINRASKELLYIPVDPVHTYQPKAWIDRLGYHLFKVAGSTLILLLTQWLTWSFGVNELAWLTLAICLAWTGIILVLAREYRIFVPAVAAAE